MTVNTDSMYEKQLQDHLRAIHQYSLSSIGFPTATDFNYEAVYPFFGYMLNNIGDPYEDALYKLQTKEFEREVIDFFADMFRAPQDDRWGYVTSGGSEGNLYGMYLARELYPEARVYFSAASHYSVDKAASVLRIPTGVVAAQPSGEIDYDALCRAVGQHAGRPAIVVANIGTTMTEAKDDVARIHHALDKAGVGSRYIHSDAALAGIPAAMLLPHVPFDIQDGADSISISGHKFIGSPMPCGIVVTRDSVRKKVARSGMYVGSADTTITGSRNAQAPLFMWSAIKRWGVEGFARRAKDAVDLADYAVDKMGRTDYDAWRNPNAMTVVFKTPAQRIVDAWQLATYDGWSHIVCMPGMTRQRLDAFINDLQRASLA